MENRKVYSKLIWATLMTFLICLFPITPALAQESEEVFDEEAIFRFEEYVVTAAKYKQKISESPSTITVITEEDIKHSGATNLGDLLRIVPGLEVMELSPSDHEIGARGQNQPLSNGILAMVNGRSIYLDFWGVVLWDFIDIPLESIKRIEVIRGPGSALYGANAFHGVVNIITKEPGDSQGTTVSFTGGELNTYIGTAIHSGKYGDLGYLLSAGWDQTSHWEGEKISRRYPRGRVSLNYGLDHDSKITFEGGIVNGEGEIFYYPIGLVEAEGRLGNLMLEYQRSEFYLRTFWNRLDLDRLFCDGDDMVGKSGLPPQIEIRQDYDFEEDLVTDTFDIESQYIFDIGQVNSIVAGADFRYNTMDSTMIAKYRTQTLFAGYLQHEFRLRGLLTSFLSIRYDRHPQVGDVFSPRGSLIISAIEPHIFRLSVGRSFRNPSMAESYAHLTVPIIVLDLFDGKISALGNEDLEPEKLTSYEFGYQTRFTDRIRFDLNLFFNQIDDMVGVIVRKLDMLSDPPLVEVEFLNMYNRSALGAEAGVELSVTDWLKGFLNYAYTKVEDADRKTLKMTPTNKLNGGIRLILKNGFSSNLTVHYVSDTLWPWPMEITEELREKLRDFPELVGELKPFGKTDDYTIVNLRLGYEFWEDRVEAALSCFNILDDKHKEYPLTENIGRKISGSIALKF
ncbi:MAG: TonB-dependent receptor [Deltaproteobacteria bacterium]|nr:MAG: TonB-dependent receptor [Deltaproteobacteria bacterium]